MSGESKYVSQKSITQHRKDNYFYKIDANEVERLKILNNLLNKDTCTLLDGVSLKEGNIVLELGCGLSIISVELAKRVGPQGRVIAIDDSNTLLNHASKYIKEQGISNIQHQKLNIYEIDAQTFSQKFDVIYGRFIIMNLSNPITELERLLGLLKKGGTIILEEAIISHSFCYPSHPVFTQWQAALKSNFKKDQKDADFGLQLPSLFRRNGIRISEQKIVQVILNSPEERSLISRVFLHSKENLGTLPEFSHLVTELQNLEKQDYIIALGPTFQIVGRR